MTKIITRQITEIRCIQRAISDGRFGIIGGTTGRSIGRYGYFKTASCIAIGVHGGIIVNAITNRYSDGTRKTWSGECAVGATIICK